MNGTRSTLGIDEAGYGPTLGPLVIGGVRIDGPHGALGRAWELAQRADPTLPRLDDSKRLYSSQKLQAIEHVALAALLASEPHALDLSHLCGDVSSKEEHPWYLPELPLPLEGVESDLRHSGRVLREALATLGASLEWVHAEVVLEGPFNRRIEMFGNKGAAHLDLIERCMRLGWPEDGVGSIRCDRLGGRKFYTDLLLRLFPFRPVDTLEEHDEVSRYVVEDGLIDVAFLVKGESHAPEIALASCIAKYVREVHMVSFNRYFGSKIQDLAPTAGYPEDARRWLDELRTRGGACGSLATLLTRVR